MKKHIDDEHDGIKEGVDFSWRVLKKYNKPLQRQLHEAVRIQNKKPEENLNSKSEFNGQRVQRIGLEKSHIVLNCKICGATSETLYKLNEHELKFHTRMNCDETDCGYISFGRTDLIEHKKNTHATTK